MLKILLLSFLANVAFASDFYTCSSKDGKTEIFIKLDEKANTVMTKVKQSNLKQLPVSPTGISYSSPFYGLVNESIVYDTIKYYWSFGQPDEHKLVLDKTQDRFNPSLELFVKGRKKVEKLTCPDPYL